MGLENEDTPTTSGEVVEEATAPDSGSGDDDLQKEPERKTSTGSGDILLSQIQVIINPSNQDDDDDDSEEETDEEEEKPKKKMVKKKKRGAAAPKPADVLTKTLAQAIRLINEQREKERQKARKAEIRRLALEQKQRMESGGAGRVILHV